MTDPKTNTAPRNVLNVLIVDEDPDSRVAARKALQRAQLGVRGETGFGTEAVSLALAARPDAVLLAVEEPSARALETGEAIASALPDTPVIIYSSVDDAPAVRRAMVFGARDYLLKPLQGSTLRDTVFRSMEAEERRQLRRAGQLGLQGRGTIISVTGAKGGVGKTVIAVNLAVALRLQTGKSVAVLDADTQFGDVATMFDLTPARTSLELLKSLPSVTRDNIRDYVTRDPAGVDVLAAHAEEESWAGASSAQLSSIIELLAQVYEFVIIDTAGSFDAFVRTCIEASTLTLVITSGEVSSVRDTASAMRRLGNWNIDADKVRLVLNRGRKAPGIKSDEVARAVGRPIFWEVPFDGAVAKTVQLGRPIVAELPGSALGKSATLLARRIAGTSRALVAPPSTRRTPFWRRLPQFKGNKNDSVAAAPEATDS